MTEKKTKLEERKKENGRDEGDGGLSLLFIIYHALHIPYLFLDIFVRTS